MRPSSLLGSRFPAGRSLGSWSTAWAWIAFAPHFPRVCTFWSAGLSFPAAFWGAGSPFAGAGPAASLAPSAERPLPSGSAAPPRPSCSDPPQPWQLWNKTNLTCHLGYTRRQLSTFDGYHSRCPNCPWESHGQLEASRVSLNHVPGVPNPVQGHLVPLGWNLDSL